MKTLYLVRHGKSTWRHQAQNDIERPLKKKGVNNTIKIVDHLKEKAIEPDLLVSSPAKRAIETAELFAEAFDYPKNEIKLNRSLYSSSVQELMAVILYIDRKYRSAILFGHDPTLTNLASFLTKQSFEKIPTSGVVSIDFNLDDWSKVAENSGNLKFFVYPKLLL